MRRLLVVIVVSSVACLSCGLPRAIDSVFQESRPINSKVSLHNRPINGYCVHAASGLEPLCDTTTGANAVGWNDRFVGVRIDVPSKEFLLIDTERGFIWVLSAEEFAEAPEAKDLRMIPVDHAWRQLARTST